MGLLDCDSPDILVFRCLCKRCAILRESTFVSVFLYCESLLMPVGAMDITVAYYHPFFRFDVVKHDFEQIRTLGAGSIVYAIHEQEETRYLRDLERGFRLAQDAGLKVYLSLGRFGNLFAGPSL